MTTFDTEDLKTELNTIIHDKSMENNTADTIEELNVKNEHDEYPKQISYTRSISRPHTLEDFVKESLLQNCDEESSFTFNGLDSDEELLLMDIPGTINPLDLKGQTIQIGDKSKFKIKEDTYCAITKNIKSSFTCVFSTDNELARYKTVNIKPHKIIKVRRKLSNITKKKFEIKKSEGVPYPKNIKQRHPFFGVREL